MTISNLLRRPAVLALLCLIVLPPAGKGQFLSRVRKAPYYLMDSAQRPVNDPGIEMTRRWEGDICQVTVTNHTQHAISLGQLRIADLEAHGLDSGTAVYGEGFQMLSQTAGTLASPVDLSPYTDRAHYRLPEMEGMRTVYNLLTLHPKDGSYILLGFTSSKKFIGQFAFSATRLVISEDGEGLSLAPGASWRLEDFTMLTGPDKNALLQKFAGYVGRNHPRLPFREIATGWCSWYSYFENLTKEIMQRNISRFHEILPEIKYIQIDDGYERYLGDWLDNSPDFGSMDSMVADIRSRGFEPAIWVAPFIAEKNSKVFREHPDWFVKNAGGEPLNSGTIGFGGWRNGPWYVLDGTNPEVQRYLERVFRSMRERWNMHYFKLDANYWGAIRGRHYDSLATRTEAYRRGMQAVLRGAGDSAIILGCNAPLWPSLGLVTAMRTSNDISRKWRDFAGTGRENLNRAWQNGRFWINDPDCLLLTNDDSSKFTKDMFLFHATVLHAIGGMILNGDKADQLTGEDIGIIKKLLPPGGRSAIFRDERLGIGITENDNQYFFHCLNWSDTPVHRVITLPRGSFELKDYWTGMSLGVYSGSYDIGVLPGRAARLIVATRK